nr:uncharacterized protein CTRU02_12061 [Colletotrichum truncatum]KAF6785129.1 hypothetical protein CTRU02_12061 [Colletotrichum truncatum]
MMYLARLLTSCLLARVAAAAEQKPIGPGLDTHPPPIISDHGQTPVRWHRSLNFSSSAPHLFASAYGLLQQWSNTVFPNGHTMAAVEIPAFTLLYHGRMDEEAAPSPEWLAFDM